MYEYKRKQSWFVNNCEYSCIMHKTFISRPSVQPCSAYLPTTNWKELCTYGILDRCSVADGGYMF